MVQSFHIFYLCCFIEVYLDSQARKLEVVFDLVSHSPQILWSSPASWLPKYFFSSSLLIMPTFNALTQSHMIFYETSAPVSVTLASSIDPLESILHIFPVCPTFLTLYCSQCAPSSSSSHFSHLLTTTNPIRLTLKSPLERRPSPVTVLTLHLRWDWMLCLHILHQNSHHYPIYIVLWFVFMCRLHYPVFFEVLTAFVWNKNNNQLFSVIVKQ